MLRLPFPSVSALGPGIIPRLLDLLSPREPAQGRAPPPRLGQRLLRWLEEEL